MVCYLSWLGAVLITPKSWVQSSVRVRSSWVDFTWNQVLPVLRKLKLDCSLTQVKHTSSMSYVYMRSPVNMTATNRSALIATALNGVNVFFMMPNIQYSWNCEFMTVARFLFHQRDGSCLQLITNGFWNYFPIFELFILIHEILII